MQTYDPIALLQLLLTARGPSGQEDEIRTVCQELMQPLCQDVWEDAAGNVVGKIAGKDSTIPPIRIMVHMDELAMIVKRINDDGSLAIASLSKGMFPSCYGQGMVEVMGDSARILGVLSYGSVHTTKETENVYRMKPKPYGKGETVEWEDVKVVTRKSPEKLKSLGIHPGTRVVIAQSRRHLQKVEDCLAGYFMDNRAAIAVAMVAVNKFLVNQEKPACDVYLVATVCEEIGAEGANYAARSLPGDISIAIDVGPVAKEYQVELSSAPIIVYQDACSTYDKQMCDRFVEIGNEIGLEPQLAVWSNYGSDASIPKHLGQSAKAGLLCLPTENTHGFEIIHEEAISRCAELLHNYLKKPH